MENKWFISIDDPQIKIRSHIKNQFRNVSQEAEAIGRSDNNDNFRRAQAQYSNGDDKWTMSLSNFFKGRAIEYEKQRQFKESQEDSLDELNLLEVQRNKYISLNDTGALRKCGGRIDDCLNRLYLAVGCIIINNDVDLTFDIFKQHITSELKKINLPFGIEDIKFIFIECLRYFSDIVSTTEYLDYIKNLNLPDTDRQFRAQERFLLERKKALRKKVFEESNGEVAIKKEVLTELCNCTERLSNVMRLLRKEEEALIEQAELYKYRAYNSDNIESIKTNFDEAATILERLSKQNRNNEKIKRELIFTKARKSEYLSRHCNDLYEKNLYLQEAEKYYGKLHDPRSFLIKFLISYYKIKYFIAEKNDFSAAINHSIKILQDKNAIDDLINQFPTVEDIVRVCELLSFFPLNQSNGSIIDQLYKLRPNDKKDFLRSLWGIISSHHILSFSIPLHADLERFFKDSTVELLKSGKIEKSLENLFFAGDTEKPSKEIIQYLQQEEGRQLEFKGSLSLDVKKLLFSNKQDPSESLRDEVLGAVVAFLNSSGGSLILGVLEDREDFKKYNLPQVGKKLIFGVEKEYGKKGFDDYMLKIQDLMKDHIDNNLPSLVNITRHTVKNHDIVQIEIPEGREWYYLDNETFYVRENNRTVKKKGKDADKYRELKPRK